jgi:hypothetical protein
MGENDGVTLDDNGGHGNVWKAMEQHVNDLPARIAFSRSGVHVARVNAREVV